MKEKLILQIIKECESNSEPISGIYKFSADFLCNFTIDKWFSL